MHSSSLIIVARYGARSFIIAPRSLSNLNLAYLNLTTIKLIGYPKSTLILVNQRVWIEEHPFRYWDTFFTRPTKKTETPKLVVEGKSFRRPSRCKIFFWKTKLSQKPRDSVR